MKCRYNIPKDELVSHLNNHLSYKQIANIYGCSHWTVLSTALKYGLRSDLRAYQQKMNNIAKDINVRSKISETVKQKWNEGYYNDRVNGMLGVKGLQNSHFKQSNHFRDKCFFYNEKKCHLCGDDNVKIDVHHVDENHDNNILSNLEPLCVKCHQKFHYKKMKMPFVQVTKIFHFEAAHFLPLHEKKCKFLHGHSYKLEVTVKRRVNKETGMVIDYGDLKKAVEENVIEKLDHSYLNTIIPVSTTENICLWIWESLSRDIKGLERIKIYETEGSFCELTKDMVLDFVKNCKIETEWSI